MTKPCCRRHGLGVFVFVAWVSAAPAQDELQPSQSGRPPEEEKIAGVVVDQTITRVGHDFYTGFLGRWRDLNPNDEHSLVVRERPSARWGSLMTVEAGFARVFQTFVYPGRIDPRSVGERAAAEVYDRVTRIDAESLLFTDPDMGKDEL